jgi:ABC-type sulfate transport system permease component
MVRKFPSAVTVTLYRPFLWEVKNPLMLLSALESLIFLIFTIVVFFKVGIVKTFSKIFTQPTLLFSFLFSIIFAFAVGLSTGNFGTLSRYKIPCMPFFAALLLLLYFQNKQEKTANVNYTKRSVRHLA